MNTLLVFSHLRWNFVFQRPQHLLTRLAKYYEVIYVEEPITAESCFLEERKEGDVTVLVPHTNLSGWGFNDEQLPEISKLVLSWLKNKGIERPGLWLYTPQAVPIIEIIQPSFVVFDVMDELSMFAGAPPELKTRETKLLQVADIVIAGGPSLWKSKSQVRPDALLLPSSVDARHYSPSGAAAREAVSHEEDKLEHDIAKPRLGFFGVIDERLDVELVAKIADSNKHWSIVMVGPVVKIDPTSLPRRDNIHWLGQQPYSILPQLVQGWDVCMLPFALNDSTKFISPTKTLEYMAAEKPIVSTNIHDVASLYSDVVSIGMDHEHFITEIALLLSEDTNSRADRISAQLRIVAGSNWDSTAEIVHQAIEGVLLGKSRV